MSQTILFKEGDLESTTLLLNTSNQRMVGIPRHIREQTQTWRVIDITTTIDGINWGYETDTNSNSFVYTRITCEAWLG